MLLRFADVYIDAIWKISDAFFEFTEYSRKGHRFLLEFSENYQFYFAIKPEYPGAYRLLDAPAFLFSEIYHLGGLMGVRKHV